MTRSRPLVTALGAGCTLAAAEALTPLVRTAQWFGAATAAVLALAVLGALARAVRVPWWLVPVPQLVVGVGVVLARTGQATGPWGVPTPADLARVPALAAAGADAVRRYAAPAPATPGLMLVVAGLTVLVAVAVDALAVGRRAPAAAGFPLLTLYLVACVNSPSTLAWTTFLPPALGWLLLVVLGTTAARRSALPASAVDPADVVDDAGWSATAVTAVAVTLAVLLQALLPAPQTRFVARGLGRTATPRSGGAGGFASDVDIARDLADRSTDPVLQLRVDGRDTPPLAVAQAVTYVDGHWRVAEAGAGVPLGPTPPPARAGWVRHVEVTSNAVTPPQMPTPGRPLAVTGTRAGRTADDLLVSFVARARPFGLTYLQPTPARGEIEDATGPTRPPGGDASAVLAVPLPRTSVVAATARRVVADPRYTDGAPGTAYHDAMAIQSYLRGGDFLYDTTLAPTPRAADGSPMDPVSAFLTTRRGYCVQFATAMAMMARSLGIPARVRLGYLVGLPDLSGAVTVRHSDAHMWPELYLPGTGWTRFEPTPGGRAGQPPAYARPAATPTPTATPSPERDTPTAAPTRPAPTPAPAADDGPNLLVRGAGTLLVLAAAALLLAVRPAVVALARRRRRARADGPSQVVETQWAELRERLADLGVDVPAGASPAAAARAVRADSSLPPDAREAVAQAAAVVERARYARPGGAPGGIDAAAVARLVAPTRAWRTRARALLWPRSPR